MVEIKDLLKQIFSQEVKLTENQSIIYGQATLKEQRLHILGVKESIFLGAEQALIMAQHVIDILESQSTDPVLLLVDVAGQELTMRDEWLGMQQYFGHLLECLECLRQQGNILISLVCNKALGGAFIAYGLTADTILALPDAALAVMWLEGIAKVTKIELSTLQELSKTFSVFAPGVQNFYELGGLHEIVNPSELADKINLAIQKQNPKDERALLGSERGGRKLAYSIINKVTNYL
ncbi:malonate decarboxylase subunit gamma [Fluoribacter dumoffii]|uniref:biotin-independent malonate decarboxylase subunit gamma n=1 Tax=Fluoribacter dumoffii TaxID=463 RepID=UPI002242F3BE|nr:biotin-independent malonate decarboxylase subunit gamma [Fluoribacter dumoffii]MCW8386361.1 malonate decarboxylase subunit gamma [Fluoribacter dumoffii]MCW8419414.1 malonate decarboxylase subunit gamma [Fluoribacter dumoffii]MCW8452711.1 malonate decarboxylase subunit gamma [Fluoribacter dumoffii]MCW8460039.1 malonate decarboxylase subunit gamma [Fluoribacter dumoffii]MCW8483517.1 malonate decarboxylase subunit gamma [Fluoribacter dumoffii]